MTQAVNSAENNVLAPYQLLLLLYWALMKVPTNPSTDIVCTFHVLCISRLTYMHASFLKWPITLEDASPQTFSCDWCGSVGGPLLGFLEALPSIRSVTEVRGVASRVESWLA